MGSSLFSIIYQLLPIKRDWDQMACGEKRDVVERYWATCYYDTSVWCGFDWCSWHGFPYPCGNNYCDVSIPYPCRKSRTVVKYCYDFSSFSNNCYGFYETHSGCCDGKEYDWSDGCFGYFTGVFQSGTRCFDEPLKDNGSCREGSSIPRGGTIPGGVLEPGSVSPRTHENPLTVKESISKSSSNGEFLTKKQYLPASQNKPKIEYIMMFFGLFLMKLGVCPTCMKLSFITAGLFTGIYYVTLASSYDLFQSILVPLVVVFDSLALAHIGAFSIRKILGMSIKSCPCKTTIV